MDRRDDREVDVASGGLGEELLEALARLAGGDFSVRVRRDYTRNTDDTLAYFVNIIAEETGRLLVENENAARRLSEGVEEINKLFLAIATGDFSVRVNRDESGDPIDVLGFFFNTTVEELEASFESENLRRETLHAILDSISDGVVLVGVQGEVAEANTSLSKLLGRQVAPGTPFLELVADRDRELVDKIICGELDAPRARDILFHGPANETITLVTTTKRLPSTGEIGGVVFSLRDERELRLARAQLQVADRMATMGTLAAGVAHEINNPMSFLLSNIDFVLEELEELGPDKPMPPRIHEELVRALTASREGGDRITKIVRDLKSMSRIEQEHLSAISVRDVFDSAVSMLRREIRTRARLEVQCENVPRIRLNEARLVQICLNLLQNAAHAIAPGNPDDNLIRLTGRMSKPDEFEFSVSDTGAGIPAEHLETIFDPFVTSKRAGKGMGLGLSICRRLIDGMGGRIEVDSEVGVGTTFRVTIPVAA